MARVHGFGPIADRHAEVLVLGSMPGGASLAAGQYYAHPRNAFWPIFSELLGFSVTDPYETKLGELRSARIAVWDVLRSCTREGSLDSKIEGDTRIANDFGAFFDAHRKVRRIFFNGATAEACFQRLVLRQIDVRPLDCVRLPSTSPANASWSFARKVEAWRRVVSR